MYHQLLSFLKELPARFIPHPTPIHLRGLSRRQMPANQLWREVHSETNLKQAFLWLCKQNTDAHHNHDVWDYRYHWAERKTVLRARLVRGDFAFQPVHMVEVRNEQGEIERREVRCAEDRLVVRALAQVLRPVLSARLSPHCTHLSSHGGVKQALRDTQDYIAAHPDSFVIKSDVKGYYASIDHTILAEQLRALLPHEIELHRLVWNFMRRTTEYGGNYTDVERGLPLGASLSPLLGAVYLSPLDTLGAGAKEGFYRRYMDDWVLVLPKAPRLAPGIERTVRCAASVARRDTPE